MMIAPDAAWRLVVDCIRPLPAVSTVYNECLDARLAQTVRADRDIPAAARSAMDGYAVRSEDITQTPTGLSLSGEIPAGSKASPAVMPGCCVRIMTGANIPPGADSVIRIEDTTEDNGTVSILKPVKTGSHIIARGENAKANEILLEPGTRLDASALAILAAVGCTNPLVFNIPSIGIITTGSELKAPDEPVSIHEIRDSNGPLLKASMSAHGFHDITFARAGDDRDLLTQLITSSLNRNDVTLISGGVSVGKYDFVPGIIADLDGNIRFHGVAMKPGKPLLFATFQNNRFAFGLPGNPLAVLTGLHEYALPAIRMLAGCPLSACRPMLRIPLAGPLATKGPRQHYLPARLVHAETGTAALPLPHSGSSDFVTGCRADGTIVVPRGTAELAAGTIVEFRPWRAS